MGNSAVDVTVPVAGNPTTISVRENFSTIKSEIEELQDRADDELSNRPLQVPQPPATLTTNEVLTWNGSAWVPQTVRQLHGKAFNAAAPTEGQQLRWNNTAGEWQAVTNQVKLTGDVTADGDASPTAGIAAKVVQLQGKAVVAEGANSPLAGQALVFDGNRWVPTSGGAAPQSIIFRSFSLTPYDLHTWIPDGTEGLFAGAGSNILHAPDAGEWRFLAHCSSVMGEQMILAMSGNGRENGRLLQKIKAGGVWSDWNDYPANEPSAFLGRNLIPSGPVDTTGFSNYNMGQNDWETQWSTGTGGATLAYALDAPTIVGHWYRLDFSWASGLPTTIAYLRNGADNTTGQQMVISILYPPSGNGNTQSYFTGQATGAFTHLVFTVISSGQGPGAVRLREFNPDLTVELTTTQPTAAAGWSTGDSGVNATFTHASGNTEALVYPLTAPTKVGDMYFVYWQLASTSGQYAVNVFLRTDATTTAGQLQFGAEGDNRPDEPGWGNVKRSTGVFTHLVVVPNTAFTGTFKLLHVCHTQPVEDHTRLLTRMDAANFVIGSSPLRFEGLHNLAVGVDSMIGNSTGTAMRNLAIGQEALRNLTTGQNNTALGYRALRNLSAGGNNVAIGQNTMGLATGSNNVAIGSSVAGRLAGGSSNVIIGSQTASQLTSASSCVFIGSGAGRVNNTGSSVVAIGQNALYGATAYAATGMIAVGMSALYSLTSGTYNCVVGQNAMYGVTTASNCVAVGYQAGRYRTGTTAENTMENSIYVGTLTRSGGAGRTNQIVIGYDVDGGGSNTVTLGSANSTAGYRCQVAWTVGISDIRGKEQVEAVNLDRCVETVMALPVSRWKWRDFLKRPNQHEIGWLADDVQAVFPKSVSICDERYGDHEIKDCKHHNANHEALPVLWGAVQALVAKIEALEEKLNERK